METLDKNKPNTSLVNIYSNKGFALVYSENLYNNGIVSKKDIPINEKCAYNPASPYALSKISQDLLGHVYFKNYNLKVIRTRMFTYINPKRSDLFATSFATQVALIEKGKQKLLNILLIIIKLTNKFTIQKFKIIIFTIIINCFDFKIFIFSRL